MSAPKTHLELHGWEIRRGCHRDQFVLYIRGFATAMAGGALDHVARALDRFIAQGVLR